MDSIAASMASFHIFMLHYYCTLALTNDDLTVLILTKTQGNLQ